ncbi:MAG: hypothetical protein IJ085_08440, partial [Turicibacter sp.]|nr:hypothetical protein [Turicibacter sp.]
MTLTIFDETGKTLGSFSLNGNDHKHEIETKLLPFINQYRYHYDYYINIDIMDEQTRNVIITNVELESEQIPTNAYQEDVLTAKDYFTNVRFKLDSQIGLIAIYNEAPE